MLQAPDELLPVTNATKASRCGLGWTEKATSPMTAALRNPSA